LKKSLMSKRRKPPAPSSVSSLLSKRTKPAGQAEANSGNFTASDFGKFRKGMILEKEGVHPLLLVKEVTPFWSKDKKFLVANYKTGEMSDKSWDAFTLLVYGYKPTVEAPSSKLDAFAFANSKDISSMMTKKQKLLDKESEPSTLCNNGIRFPLSKCSIVEGGEFFKHGKKPKVKGKKVLGVKVLCPKCSKLIGLVMLKKRQAFWTTKHIEKIKSSKRTHKAKEVVE